MESCKLHCVPKWMNSSAVEILQFCIKSNVMCLFIKNSVQQTDLDNKKEDRLHWTRPAGGDLIPSLIVIYDKMHMAQEQV